MCKLWCCIVLALLPLFKCYAQSSYIHVVGSSTLFPLVSLSAEEFGRKNRIRIPVIESNGTGNGFKLFCQGVGNNTPDIVAASRKMSASEERLCAENEVSDILEIKIGYDGIVVASSIDAQALDFSEKDLFLALSSHVANGNFGIKKNPNLKWSDVNAMLPDRKIEVYGPSRETGTYDAVINMIFLPSCLRSKAFNMEYNKDFASLKNACSIIRDDGSFIEMGNDENLIVQKVTRNPNIFGIFGYNFFSKNKKLLNANKISGVTPTYENIANGHYVLSRPLYLYLKKQHLKKVKNLDRFVQEITNEVAIGKKGYLVEQGLVALSETDFAALQEKVKQALSE